MVLRVPRAAAASRDSCVYGGLASVIWLRPDGSCKALRVRQGARDSQASPASNSTSGPRAARLSQNCPSVAEELPAASQGRSPPYPSLSGTRWGQRTATSPADETNTFTSHQAGQGSKGEKTQGKTQMSVRKGIDGQKKAREAVAFFAGASSAEESKRVASLLQPCGGFPCRHPPCPNRHTTLTSAQKQLPRSHLIHHPPP